MKVSLNWLKDYIQLSESPEEIAQLLTQSGLEVAGRTTFEPVPGGLRGLVIGQVMSCTQHPNADQLKLTQVDVGQAVPLHIVCGASNVQADQKVVVAPVGVQLYSHNGTTFKIKKAKIRGEVSEGMLCAEDEIGLGQAHEGIMVLDTSLPPGTPAAQHFAIQSDEVLEIDLTPNRGDACSHIGVARELGALLDRSVQYPAVAAFSEAPPFLPIQVDVLDYQACPRYSGLVISGIQVQSSPPWLRDRLRAIGLSPINNIVDVTNFVMHELGQPLHVFDYDQIVDQKVTVKQLEPGALFVTLDGVSRKLSGAELMICDATGGMCMAGILGGQRTGIQPNTQNVFLESAYFAPGVIRKAAKQHALKTDASFRYERGADPNLTVYALQRAYALIQEVAQGKQASPLIDLYPKKIAPFEVKVYYKNIVRLLGVSIPQADIKRILDRLEIMMSDEEADSFVASVPPYRGDVRREVDLIEELARIYGYESIETTGKLGSAYLARTTQPAQHQLRHGVAALLAAYGYHEIYTNSLTKSAYTGLNDASTAQPVAILNPLSEALDTLRTTLLWGGLEAIVHNINRKQPDLKLFEFGKVYCQEGDRYVENNRLALWLTGHVEATNWIRKPKPVTFHDLNAVLYKILHQMGLSNFSTVPFESAMYQTGIQVMLGPEQLLTAGVVHPSVRKQLGIEQPVLGADIDWDLLVKAGRPTGQYQAIAKFPPVKRDVSLVLDASVSFEGVKKVIAQHHEPLIQEVAVFDVYTGEKIGLGKKAYALSFVLQGHQKTLDDKTIDRVMGRLMRTFEEQLGAIIRT